jgi:hypothetical protein
MTEIPGGTIVGLSTDVTSPTTAVIKPRDEGINVGSALLAAYDSGRTRCNSWNFVFAMRKRAK